MPSNNFVSDKVAVLLFISQLSRTLLSILAGLNNAVVWIVSTFLLIYKSLSPFTNPSGIVPSAPITTGITITFMFHSFFSSLAKSRNLSLFILSFIFTLLSVGIAESTIWQALFFLLMITWSVHLVKIR